MVCLMWFATPNRREQPMAQITTSQLLALKTMRDWCASGKAKAVREANNLTVAEVANTVQVGHTAVSRWERGLRVPRGVAALRYANLLRVLDQATEAEKSAA